jgi:hypothetical protein
MRAQKIVWILYALTIIQIVSALKPAPASFYGYVGIKEGYAQKNSVIEVFDSTLALCGSFTITQEGGYGLLLCSGDDPETMADEGAAAGDILTFHIDGKLADTKETVMWQSSALQQIDLSLGNLSKLEPFKESPTEIYVSRTKDTLIKAISLAGCIILIIIFLWVYNRK